MLRLHNVRIFLDSKDLINLFRRSIPMSVADARGWFDAHDATLVLAHSSVSEFVPVDESDKLRIRIELQELERFPLAYIRLGDIQCRELKLAAEDFAAGCAPRLLDPYVPHFWRTFWDSEQTTLHDVLITQEVERRVNFRLHDQVLMLWTEPENFRNRPQATAGVQNILDSIRSESRTPRQKFDSGVRDALNACACDSTAYSGVEDWLRSRPTIAPGWRLQYEVLQEWAANTTDNAKGGDLHDVVHLLGVPYVDFATLDRRFVDYASRATKRLHSVDPAINNDSRVLRTFADLVEKFS